MKRDSNGCKLHKNGNKTWKNSAGQYHRTDGPAIERADGTKEWYINGQLHRVDGPAIEWASGDKYWYFKGKQISEKEFNSNEFQVKIIMES